MCDTVTCNTSVDQFGPDTYCKCYAVVGEDPSRQFCAYTDSEGVLIPCDVSCCKGGQGCPGQCTPSSEAGPPEGMTSQVPLSVKEARTKKRTSLLTPFKVLLLTTIFLVILSTLSLFIT